ncbi:hypothetical protein [Mammaliicoccus sciuri]|uniref:hypothetical protein n=1 Tax=Mammaliicoccus sciuri TaxID=1296 RepID=UPI003F544C3F
MKKARVMVLHKEIEKEDLTVMVFVKEVKSKIKATLFKQTYERYFDEANKPKLNNVAYNILKQMEEKYDKSLTYEYFTSLEKRVNDEISKAYEGNDKTTLITLYEEDFELKDENRGR